MSSADNIKTKLKMALVYDAFDAFNPPGSLHAQSEWESKRTVQSFVDAWHELGFEVLELPFNATFFDRWNAHVSSIDIVHSVLEGWGHRGREGWIPSLCELSGIPCIGSPSWSHNLCMGKSATKTLVASLGIPTPQFFTVQCEADIGLVPMSLTDKPHFIKPDCEGSGMGISIDVSLGKGREHTLNTVNDLLLKFPDGILIESLLQGAEYCTAVLDSQCLPIAQIEVESGVYGYAEKTKEYMPEKVTFPNVSFGPELQSQTLQICRLLGIQDFCRMDWKLDANGIPHFLEVNTLAGLSPHYSVFPKMAQEANFDFKTMLFKLSQMALGRKDHRALYYGSQRLREFSPSRV